MCDAHVVYERDAKCKLVGWNALLKASTLRKVQFQPHACMTAPFAQAAILRLCILL